MPCFRNTDETQTQDVKSVYIRVFVLRHYHFLNPWTDFD